jgi:hypothetical protein
MWFIYLKIAVKFVDYLSKLPSLLIFLCIFAPLREIKKDSPSQQKGGINDQNIKS